MNKETLELIRENKFELIREKVDSKKFFINKRKEYVREHKLFCDTYFKYDTLISLHIIHYENIRNGKGNTFSYLGKQYNYLTSRLKNQEYLIEHLKKK